MPAGLRTGVCRTGAPEHEEIKEYEISKQDTGTGALRASLLASAGHHQGIYYRHREGSERCGSSRRAGEADFALDRKSVV